MPVLNNAFRSFIYPVKHVLSVYCNKALCETQGMSLRCSQSYRETRNIYFPQKLKFLFTSASSTLFIVLSHNKSLIQLFSMLYKSVFQLWALHSTWKFTFILCRWWGNSYDPWVACRELKGTGNHCNYKGFWCHCPQLQSLVIWHSRTSETFYTDKVPKGGSETSSFFKTRNYFFFSCPCGSV